MDYVKELKDRSVVMRNERLILDDNTYSRYVYLDDAINIIKRAIKQEPVHIPDLFESLRCELLKVISVSEFEEIEINKLFHKQARNYNEKKRNNLN